MRNDIHSPKNMKPEDYTFLGAYLADDIRTDPQEELAYELMDRLEYTFKPEEICWIESLENLNTLPTHRYGQCDHCGARFKYGAVFHHKDGDDIVVGHICATDAFHNTNEARAHERMLKVIKAAKARIENAKLREKFLNEHPGLREAFQAKHYIISDVHNRFMQYCEISPKQVDLVLKLALQEAQKAQRIIEREKSMVDAPVITEGRIKISGVVLTVKETESQFGTIYKVLVEDGNGNRYFGTCPVGALGSKHGDTIEFTATVTKKDDHFGFFSRPKMVTEKIKLTRAEAEKLFTSLSQVGELSDELSSVENEVNAAISIGNYDLTKFPYTLERNPKVMVKVREIINS